MSFRCYPVRVVEFEVVGRELFYRDPVLKLFETLLIGVALDLDV